MKRITILLALLIGTIAVNAQWISDGEAMSSVRTKLNNLKLDHDSVLENSIIVAKSAGHHNTIQAALDVADAGDVILIYPGTYTETITLADNDLTLIGVGSQNSVIVQQTDANVVDFNTRTGSRIVDMKIRVTAATSALATITGSTGDLTVLECVSEMTTSTNVAAAGQACVGEVSGAGTLKFSSGEIGYYHTGDGGGTAQKGAVKVGTGGTVHFDRVHDITITNSGTALTSAVAIDQATTGVVIIHDCAATITDPNATALAGLAYIGGTGTTHEFYRNEIHVVATANTGYAFYAANAASTSRFFYNHLHVTDVGGTSYSYFTGASATVISHFDDIISDDGVSGTGTFTQVSSQDDGCLTLTSGTTVKPELIVENTNADASGAILEIKKEGASPADADVVATIKGSGLDDGLAAETYAQIDMISEEVAATDEAGRIKIKVMHDDGTPALDNMIDISGDNGTPGEGFIELNADENDIDFIVNSEGIADAFSIDGATGQMGVTDSTSRWGAENGSIGYYYIYRNVLELDDDVTMTFFTGMRGWGTIICNDGATYAKFKFATDGTVNLLADCTADVNNADVDTDLCIYDGGTGIIIKNRLGGTMYLVVNIHYTGGAP